MAHQSHPPLALFPTTPVSLPALPPRVLMRLCRWPRLHPVTAPRLEEACTWMLRTPFRRRGLFSTTTRSRPSSHCMQLVIPFLLHRRLPSALLLLRCSQPFLHMFRSSLSILLHPPPLLWRPRHPSCSSPQLLPVLLCRSPGLEGGRVPSRVRLRRLVVVVLRVVARASRMVEARRRAVHQESHFLYQRLAYRDPIRLPLRGVAHPGLIGGRRVAGVSTFHWKVRGLDPRVHLHHAPHRGHLQFRCQHPGAIFLLHLAFSLIVRDPDRW